MKSRLSALLAVCLLLLPLASCIRRDRLPENRDVFSAESNLGTDSGGSPVFLRLSGSARSEESRYLVLLLDWELTSTDGKNARLLVTVSLSHYRIQVGARDGGVITVGNDARAFSTPALRADDNAQSVTKLEARVFDVALSDLADKPLAVSAAWNFDGTYHGQSLGTLHASDTVSLG